MTRPIIEVESLSKRYKLGQFNAGSLREEAEQFFAKLGRKRPNPELSSEGAEPSEFWALKDISFSVQPGEVLGIIGRNGAGKSTLLKILSRVTEPTSGEVRVRGRVASLLEVGTGFHPELTGRENIFLNGTILGMGRKEIRSKFDEIVEFAEVDRFLDTPVKRYSSGMYVRLAFAVAANLEPEILIVDEVLAVGDAEFQRKCLGRMQDVAKGGRTVLFVSHNMSAVRSFCSRAVLLEGGAKVFDGAVDEGLTQYLATNSHDEEALPTEWTWNSDTAPGGEQLRLKAVRLVGDRGVSSPFTPDEGIAIEIEYDQMSEISAMRFVVILNTAAGEVAFASSDHDTRPATSKPGRYRTSCLVPANLLNRTAYFIHIYAGVPGHQILVGKTELGPFHVEGVGNQGTSWGDKNWPGAVCPKLRWEVTRLRGLGHENETIGAPADV